MIFSMSLTHLGDRCLGHLGRELFAVGIAYDECAFNFITASFVFNYEH